MESSNIQRVKIKVFGDVHGVGFRYSTIQKANELGLVGWVKNISDGVEMIAEGDKDLLEQLIDWCKRGPTFSRTDKVDVDWGEATGEFSGFEIGY